MRKKEKVKSGKYLRVIGIAVVLLIAIAVGLTIKAIADSKKEFYEDGYILVPSLDKMVTTNVNEQYYFSQGTKYQNKLGEKIVFTDTTDKEVSISATQFVHYLDGALGAFTKGVVLDLADVGQEQVKYYGVSDKTIITKEGVTYAMSYLGKAMKMNEFIWKISDDSYMLVAPEVTLHLNSATEVVLEDYVQVQYVAGGIARLVHKDGTYQTVADDAYIKTDSGLELRLTTRCFMKNGKESVSLDSMVIDASSNLKVDENEDKVKLPVFNVVNGKDGVDGNDGSNGSNGVHGYEGVTGGKGGQGSDGNEGQNGLDGVQGDDGDWGYDGKDGSNGEDAENDGASDGVASIDQLQAPKVLIENESYVIGPNSVMMNLILQDDNAMLDEDPKWVIYNRDTMSICGEGSIPRGSSGQVVTTNSLTPDTEYVLVVSGNYSNDGYSYSSDFLTKIFKTDSIGITIEKVKVTEDSIIVKTIVDNESKIGTYKVALFVGDESTTNVSTYLMEYVGGREFVFSNEIGVADGVEITSDTKYRVVLYDVKESTVGSLVSTDVAMELQTLKQTPHYKVDNGVEIVDKPITEKLTKAITSSRYKSVAVSLDNSIVDPDNGIIGYRYELFETSSIGQNINNAVPSQVKEVNEMQTVNFDIAADTNYVARVVVLFHDNEKTVEISSMQTDVFKLERSSYPAVSFVNVVNKYDSVSGYIMVEDTSNKQEMLLNHVGSDYPLILTISSKVGDPIAVKLYESIDPPDGSPTIAGIRYYYFSQDGLNRNTPYSMSLSGYVNETGLEWSTLMNQDDDGDGVTDEKDCFQYIAGANFNSGDPTPITVKAQSMTDTGSNIFAINIGFTSGLDADGNPLDASYEVGNLEKVLFSLVNKHTGVVLGTYPLIDKYVVEVSDGEDYNPKHESMFSKEAYSPNGQPQKFSNEIVLTDATFGLAGDSRIAAGGVFQIRLENAVDYTQRPDYKDFTNELDISEESYQPGGNKVIFEFTVEKRHVQVTDPNSTVTVTPIQNQDALTINPELNDDTVTGLKIDSGYTIDDVHKIIYYIYEVTSSNNEPLIKDDSDDKSEGILTKENWADLITGESFIPTAIKTVAVTSTTSEGDYVRPWVVYFDHLTGEHANVDDYGKTIFERGKIYFVRYEIVTNGKLEDTRPGDKYPNCVYTGDESEYPFYRSNVFGLKRQEPVVERYLWDTMTDAAELSKHIWKYKIYDPDGAILEYAGSIGNANMLIKHYSSFTAALENGDPINKNDATSKYAKFTSLYGTGNVFKTEYAEVSIEKLPKDQWYTIDIPYSIFNKEARKEYLKETDGTAIENNKAIVSNPMEIKAVSDIKTNIITGTIDPMHPTDAKDYFVDGVMVKGAEIDSSGIVDDYGYRIKISLSGSELYRVAALRVKLTENVAVNPKVVIFDPVEVVIAPNKYGTKNNNVAYAYLEYAPVVAAGLNSKEVLVEVEAYYTTYQMGFNSFTGYTPTVNNYEFTESGFRFTSGNAWAIRQYYYKDNSGILSYEYAYQKVLDNGGTFVSCPQVTLDVSDTLATNTLSGSVYVPSGTGFRTEVDVNNNIRHYLDFFYTTNPMCYTTISNNSFADIRYLKNMTLTMDEIGAQGSDGKYYMLEKMNVAKLQIDCGNAAGGYIVATFNTGDAMPGIDFSESASTAGMSSLYAEFNVKGELPGTDKGFYIYMYDTHGNKIMLDKYIDADGTPYYLPRTSTPITAGDRKVGTADDGSVTAYATEANGDSVAFSIKGLNSATTYTLKIMAKNSTGTLQYLFDYSPEKLTGNVPYPMTTTSDVNITSSGLTFVYNEYDFKYGFVNYAVEGSEGTGMRIFYRVYDAQGNEVDCGRQSKTDYGYALAPKGNNIKYYHSDMSQCNPVTINFNPGVLKMGSTYTVVFKAYQSDNNGNILDDTPINRPCSTSFDTPALLAEPTASMQIIAGRESIDVSGAVVDNNRTIMDDKFYVSVYDLEGKLVTESVEINMAAGVKRVAFSEVFTGLNQNQLYIVKVTADVDADNNGVTDGLFEYALTVSTISTATATVSISYTVNEQLVISLENVTNFDDVAAIRYTVDSADGNTNYTNGYVGRDLWNDSGNVYSYITSYVVEKGQYTCTLQYYDSNNRLVGSDAVRFNK